MSSYILDERQSNKLPDWQLHNFLKKAFPTGYESFERITARESQRKGIDALLRWENGKIIPVDFKVLKNDPVKKYKVLTIPLEVMSCVERNKPSYLLEGGKETRYVLFIFRSSGRIVRLPFRTLAAVFRANLEKWRRIYKVHTQETDGIFECYHSQVMFVPLAVIQDAMQEHLDQYGSKFARNEI